MCSSDLALFGIGMVLASGCGNKTLVRVGTGNLKSLTVLLVGMVASYLMLWSPLFEKAFLPWLQPATINLAQHGMPTQHAGDVIAGLLGQASSKANNAAVALMVALGMLIFVLKSKDFRGSFDNILGGAVVGADGRTIDWRAARTDIPALPECLDAPVDACVVTRGDGPKVLDRKSTRLNSSHT